MRAVRLAAAVWLAAAGLAAFPAQGQVSDEKRQLILELVRLSSSGAPSVLVVAGFLEQLEPHFPKLVEQVMIEENDLPPEQRAALARQLGDFDAFAAAFSQRFPSAIDVEAMLVEVYVPLYAQHFDEQELREMLAFYRSPTGQKMMQVMPRLLQQGLATSVPRVEPQLMRLVGEILAVRRQELMEQDGSEAPPGRDVRPPAD